MKSLSVLRRGDNRIILEVRPERGELFVQSPECAVCGRIDLRRAPDEFKDWRGERCPSCGPVLQ